jgi:chromatin remodeling complex protein RSC6
MANKKSTKVASTTNSEVTEQKEVTQKKVVSDKKPVSKKTSKKKEEEVVVEEELVEEEPSTETVTEDATTGNDSEQKGKKRSVPTKESVSTEFDDIITSIEAEISNIRDSKTKSKGIKFLRTLNKRLKSLKTQTARIKHRNSSVKRDTINNTNSGFLKPVKISTEMAKFTGWDANELKSRVDVTKYLCNYIKENSLQNPKDRREIIADTKLAKLIKYDSKKETAPLTYYRLQTYLKNHFIKPELTA